MNLRQLCPKTLRGRVMFLYVPPILFCEYCKSFFVCAVNTFFMSATNTFLRGLRGEIQIRGSVQQSEQLPAVSAPQARSS